MQVINPTPAAVYTGMSNAIATISRAEGMRSMWKGLSSVVVGAGPAHAVYFATYEAVKHAMGGNAAGGEHHPLAAGARTCLSRRGRWLTLSSNKRRMRNYS